jgi:hypothetical protein
VATVSSLSARRVTDNTDWTVEEMLIDALDRVQSGDEPAEKAMVLYYDTDDKAFRTAWSASNMRSSEMVFLIEAIKATLLRDMELT